MSAAPGCSWRSRDNVSHVRVEHSAPKVWRLPANRALRAVQLPNWVLPLLKSAHCLFVVQVSIDSTE